MQIYQNLYQDTKTGQYWVREAHFNKQVGLYNQSLIAAIDDYQDTVCAEQSYIHTMVNDIEKRTGYTIDIEDEMYAGRTPSQIKHDAECDRFDMGRKE